MSNHPPADDAMPAAGDASAELRAKASHFRQIASSFFRTDLVDAILSLADELDAQAAEIDASGPRRRSCA
jgi:hypothetical protein